LRASLSYLNSAGAGKPSPNWANYKCVILDPKPSELTMSRLKDIERYLEDRTVVRCKVLG
jgi:hypothetical protein